MQVLKPRKHGVVPVVSDGSISLVNVRYAKHVPTQQIVLSTTDNSSVLDAFDPTPYYIWVQEYIRLYHRDGKIALLKVRTNQSLLIHSPAKSNS